MTIPDDDALGLAEHAALLRHSALPTLVVNHQRRQILYVNDAALAMLGLDAELVIGRPGTDFLFAAADEHVQRLRALRGDETALLMDVPTATGVRTAELTLIPSGREGVAFVQLLDVTDLLRAAAHDEVQDLELQRTTAALRTIASRLAHDLRSPMMSIAGFANLLLDHPDDLDEAEQANLLERIRANIEAVADMTDAILSEADIGAPRPQDDSHVTEDLFELVRGVTDAQLIEAQGTMQTRATTPVLPVPVGAIRQAVINLVSNSIKYRHRDRALRVEVDVRAVPTGTEIVVRDNGQGLDDDVEILLASGTRGRSAAETPGGGLGLAFVQAAVNSLGGTVTGRSLEPGAEFVLWLPAGAPTPMPAPDGDGEAASDRRAGLTGPQLERILDAAPIPCFVIDLPLRQIISLNRAAASLLGLTPADILGRPGADFVDEADIAEALRRRVIDEPDEASALRTTLQGPSGPVPVRIWISAVEGTALAVAQAVAEDPALGTLQHG